MSKHPYIVMFDLSDNQVATIRQRLSDAEVGIQREGQFLWHLQKNDHRATFWQLGTLGNGETMFLVRMPAQGRDYLLDRLGASKVVPLLTAWNDSRVLPVLGDRTPKQWLLANGFRATTEDILDSEGAILISAGSPVPPNAPCGSNPVQYAQRRERQ